MRGLCALLFLCGIVPLAQASPGVVGHYRCLSYNVSGAGGTCRLVPPLVINADGTYRMSGEQGTWRVAGDRIHLSQSKIRGPGKLAKDQRIVFEYLYRNQRHTITYGCTRCSPGTK